MPTYPCFWIEKQSDGTWLRRSTGESQPFPTFFGPGAMWNAPWMRDTDPAKSLCKEYPDGLTLVVMTPGGDWLVDGPSYDGTQHHSCPWTRTGDPMQPETLDVSPSIDIRGSYHGWLRGGQLVDA